MAGWRCRTAYAVITGLVVVAFPLLADAARKAFEHVRHLGAIGPWLPLVWTPALAVAVLWWTQGSGIPQVVAALDDALPAHERSRLVSLRLALEKVVLVSGGLLAGLSIAS